MQLIIGNKNYSSWSLRPWLLMQHFGLEFDEQKVWLFTPEARQQLATDCPNLKVPVLLDDGTKVWDSLAICEYINDRYLDNKALPKDVVKRAEMRSVCAEMHSGFPALREEMPMNCRRVNAAIKLSDAARRDIARVNQIFSDLLAKNQDQGEFLFGDFSIADAFYMPVVSRFSVYDIELPEAVKQYHTMMLQLPAYQQWLSAAKQESAVIEIAEL